MTDSNPSAPVPLRCLALSRHVGKTLRATAWSRSIASISMSGRGEFVSLLGPSGCGKSTVLRMIAGLSEPTGGHDRMAAPRARGGAAREIGFVFQEPTLMPWATVAANVAAAARPAACRRGTAVARASTAALDRVGLADFRRALSARALRRDEDAGVDRARARHRAGAAADGRAVRGARRDHPLQAQRRPAGSSGASSA